MKIALPLSILLATVLAACSSTPPAETPAPKAPAAAAPAPAPAAVQEKKVEPVKAAPAAAPKNPFDALKDPKSLLSKREVFFDYDAFEVKLDYFPIVEAHAQFLKKNPSAKVLIQGNADERGSSEYNLALGQKRADAIKTSMKLLGAKEEQIEAVSLGKEKPKNPGHDEAAWAENRRGDILYKGEY